MIFYFSGTGNSLYVAKKLLNDKDKLISIAKEMKNNQDVYTYNLSKNESIIFVYPVYAWAPPKMVMDFVKRIKFNNYNSNYISTVITCGDDIGNAVNLFSELLDSKGLNLSSGFSIIAPNNYIIFGDVDNKEIENKKLVKLEESIKEIKNILDNKTKYIYKIDKGRVPKFTTNVINPLFNKYARSTKKFYADDNCIGCKVCEKICNTNCIKVDKKPTWSDGCSQCLACIHYCPTKAIQYGNSTTKKGRYTNPNIKIDEMY